MKRMLTVVLSVITTLLTQTAVEAQLLPPNEAGVTMGHVHLNVSDVEVHKKFWTDHFGATPLAKEGLQGVRVPGMLIVMTKRDPARGTEGTVLDHFGFKVRSLPEMLAGFRAAGVTVQSEFKGNEGFPNVYVVGPDNVRIEMQEDTTLPVRAASHHLHFMLADPMVHRAWYIDKLSLTATRRGTFETANASGMNLTFSASKVSPPIGTRGGSLDHIGFEVKDLEAYCRKLEAAGIKLDVPYRKVPNLGIAVAFLTDPSGVYIELTEGLTAY